MQTLRLRRFSSLFLTTATLAGALASLPTANACDRDGHGCYIGCPNLADGVCLSTSSTMELKVGGLRILASLSVQAAGGGAGDGKAHAGDTGTVTFTTSDADGNKNTNRTVRVTIAFAAAAGIAWDSPMSQEGTYNADSASVVNQEFRFHVADAVQAEAILPFTVATTQPQPQPPAPASGNGDFHIPLAFAGTGTWTPGPAVPLALGGLAAAAWVGRRRR